MDHRQGGPEELATGERGPRWLWLWLGVAVGEQRTKTQTIANNKKKEPSHPGFTGEDFERCSRKGTRRPVELYQQKMEGKGNAQHCLPAMTESSASVIVPLTLIQPCDGR